ncbi:MAG: CoA ester lyase [Rhodoferax sp.]|uniref:HpcH/HpaI aldolase/citrate lyase family protein n=1 Tax=Rhodoferax sp. TaxID=50421 RepID=UPI0026135D1A|nr:CoA ester lyase [Rhodoferax sp.]MDD5335826.1 CoA ester lyase [Rhodoferax sp.]
MSGGFSALVAARSFLFVPANRPERFAKALSCGADAVIIDLEDAVAPSEKLAARQQLATAFAGFTSSDKTRVVLRINAAGTPWFEEDLNLLQSLVGQGLCAVMLPKAESAVVLQQLAQRLGPGCALLPLVESLAGLDAVDALANAPQVLRLAFGNLDFQADLGLACAADEAELLPVRLALVMAARRAGLAPAIDGVTANIKDPLQLQFDTARSRRAGFAAKLCIHPTQVASVNAAFAPSAAELEWAQRVLAAFEAAGGGVFSLDGRMVDAPVLRLARRTLVQSRRTAADGVGVVQPDR